MFIIIKEHVSQCKGDTHLCVFNGIWIAVEDYGMVVFGINYIRLWLHRQYSETN